MEKLSEWIASTSLSHFLLNNEKWAVPTIQVFHIVGIGIIVGSAFMITLRILGVAGTDLSLRATQRRFFPWMVGALVVLLLSGLLLIIGEPKRELLAFSFWTKMALLALFIVITLAYQSSLARNEQRWEQVLTQRFSVRAIATLSFLILFAIIILGRFIAYDHIWRTLLPGLKA